jgi:hypothetical protein
LKFQALNYRANVWLNGQQIGRAEELAGAWRSFELNVTKVIKPGATNVLACRCLPQREGRPGHHLRRLEPRRRPTRTWACGGTST